MIYNLIWFLDYAATNPDAKVRYHASDMILRLQSDASYLSVKNDKSRVVGYFYSSSWENCEELRLNGLLFTVFNILKNVAVSAEAELVALFHNAQEGVILCTTLEELGHKQPTIPIKKFDGSWNYQ